jgi:hypothetical protein
VVLRFLRHTASIATKLEQSNAVFDGEVLPRKAKN